MANIQKLIDVFADSGKDAEHFYLHRNDIAIIREALEAKKVKEEQFIPSNKPIGDFV